jgi:hypothetical protein
MIMYMMPSSGSSRNTSILGGAGTRLCLCPCPAFCCYPLYGRIPRWGARYLPYNTQLLYTGAEPVRLYGRRPRRGAGAVARRVARSAPAPA